MQLQSRGDCAAVYAGLNCAKGIFETARVFWCSLIALNCVLFLPSVLLVADSASLLLPTDGVGPVTGFLALQHGAMGLFQVNVEFVVLAALWVNVGNRLGRYGWSVIVAVYLPLLAYQTYEGVVTNLYHEEPNFLNHYYIVRDGLPFLLRNLSLPLHLWLGMIGVAVGFSWFLVQMLRWLQDASATRRLGSGTRLTVSTLATTTLIAALWFQPAHTDTAAIVNSTVMNVQRNIAGSLALHRVVADITSMSGEGSGLMVNEQSPIARPNIYLIFIESYGSVLYARSDFDDAYRALLAQLEADLTEGGWRIASGMSESPTWGGGSWLAYTSALFGLRIDSQPQYLELVERFGVENSKPPNLSHFLKQHGYTTVWLSSLSDELTDNKREQYRNFYDIDTWLGYRDLNYVGAEYGWGPAPPDQYALEFARGHHMASATQSVFLFFITQNSHYPWMTPPLVDDWTALNVTPSAAQAAPQAESSHQQLRMAYLDAVGYELRMLTQSILNTQDEDALFILIGDHQPPRVSRKGDSFNTPLHIITRDTALYQSITGQGLQDGLAPPDGEAAFRHEELYPLVVNLLFHGSEQIGSGTNSLLKNSELTSFRYVEMPYRTEE